MNGIQNNINGLVCEHKAPTPAPINEPELPERLPEPIGDEPPVPDHNPSYTYL